ncbi:hypothetical protein JL721_394 [Aureococcus anophagefferens]|nr:hypothetical protein JL721_394 [Aureococcus anophagefferens]
MADEADKEIADDDLVDYDDDDVEEQGGDEAKEAKKGHYVGIHASGFRDFILKPECLRAVVDCGFEHPSEVQHECIPQAVLGMDIICQAKSGMGKTAVFVLATLHQLEPVDGEISVMCHTRELAFQIKNEYARFSKYLPAVKVEVFYGGVPITQNKAALKANTPHIVVGTPGRILGLVKSKDLVLGKLKHFVMDECDRMLEALDMRKDIQEIFRTTPHQKQVMMFSATLSKEIRPVCKKFCQDPMEIYVVIFVSKVARATELDRLLCECNFPSVCIHSGMTQEERITRYKDFKDFKKRILVSTDLFGRGIDIERVNIVINYDFPEVKEGAAQTTASDQYLHRVGRAGRFGTKGLSISFISSKEDAEILAAAEA